MLLDQCDLAGIDHVQMAPFERRSPEDEWVNANRDGIIPPALYELYARAGFLSFGKAPQFMGDPENLLFSYFGLIVRSVLESLLDAHEQADAFAAGHEFVSNATSAP